MIIMIIIYSNDYRHPIPCSVNSCQTSTYIHIIIIVFSFSFLEYRALQVAVKLRGIKFTFLLHKNK